MKILKILNKYRYEVKLNKTGLYRFVEAGSKSIIKEGFGYKVKYPQDLFIYEVIINGIRNKEAIEGCYNRFAGDNYDVFEYLTYLEKQQMINQDIDKIAVTLPGFQDVTTKQQILIPFLEPFINKYYLLDYQLLTLKQHRQYVVEYPRTIKNIFDLYGLQPYNSKLSSLQLVGKDDESYYFYHFDFKTVYQFHQDGMIIDEIPLIDRYTKEYPGIEQIKEALALLSSLGDDQEVVAYLWQNKFIGEKTYKKLSKKVSK